MSPVVRISKKGNGKFEETVLKSAKTVEVCIEINKGAVGDLYFRDGGNCPRFYALGLECPAPIDVGFYHGAAWYLWKWAWENEQEAEAAFKDVPENTDALLRELLTKINGLIADARAKSGSVQDGYYAHDLTGDFKKFGWELTIFEGPEETWKISFNIFKRLELRKDSQR